MRRRRRPPSHVSHDRWLVSYADFVTLLFAFFVVLYAPAQVDKQKALRLSGAIESAFQQLGILQTDHGDANDIPSVSSATNRVLIAHSLPDHSASDVAPQQTSLANQDFQGIRAELEQALASEIRRNEVALHLEPDGLVISLREIGFFDSGSATIKPGAQGAFARVAAILGEHGYPVRIEGHTDDVPIHTSQFASNWELSTARSTELVKSLIEKYDIPAGRLSAAGYAEFHPAAPNGTAKGRQLNRRVDIVILTPPAYRRQTNPPAQVGGNG